MCTSQSLLSRLSVSCLLQVVVEEVEENGEEEIPIDVIPDVPPNIDLGPEVADQQPEQEIQTHHVSTHNVD